MSRSPDLSGKPASFDVIGGNVLFQFSLAAGEDGLETVFHFRGVRRLGGIQHQAGVGDRQTVFQPQVFAREGEQESFGTGSVGQGVEDVQDDAAAFGAHLVQETAVVAEMETAERRGGRDLGILVHPAEVPPERPGAEPAPERGNPVGHRHQRLLEDERIHGFGECDAHPVQGSIVPAQRGRVDVRRIVDPHPGGNGKGESPFHRCRDCYGNKSTAPGRGRQIKVVKAGEM